MNERTQSHATSETETQEAKKSKHQSQRETTNKTTDDNEATREREEGSKVRQQFFRDNCPAS